MALIEYGDNVKSAQEMSTVRNKAVTTLHHIKPSTSSNTGITRYFSRHRQARTNRWYKHDKH
jgi:hypothetical protein